MLLILRYVDLLTDETFFRKRLVISWGIHFSSIPPVSACQLITEMPEHKITHMHGRSAPGLGGHCVLDDCLCVGVCERECVWWKAAHWERHPDSADGVRDEPAAWSMSQTWQEKKKGFPETQIPPDFTAVGIEGIVHLTKTSAYKRPFSTKV